MFKQALRVLWERWKAFGHKLATFQSRVLLFVFYYVVLGPFALAMRVFSDPLGCRVGAPTRWLERSGDTLLPTRKQF